MAAAAAGRFGRREEGFPSGHEGRCFPTLLSDRIEEEEEEKRPVKIVAGGGVPPPKVSVEG